jgi:hypothetical protein
MMLDYTGALWWRDWPAVGVDPRAPASIRDVRPEDYEAFAQFFAELHAPEPLPSDRVYEEHVAPRARSLGSSRAWLAPSCAEARAVIHVSILAVLSEIRRGGLGGS